MRKEDVTRLSESVRELIPQAYEEYMRKTAYALFSEEMWEQERKLVEAPVATEAQSFIVYYGGQVPVYFEASYRAKGASFRDVRAHGPIEGLKAAVVGFVMHGHDSHKLANKVAKLATRYASWRRNLDGTWVVSFRDRL